MERTRSQLIWKAAAVGLLLMLLMFIVGFGGCRSGSPPGDPPLLESAELVIRPTVMDGTERAGPGVRVLVDDREVGETEENGTLTVRVEPGRDLLVETYDVGLIGGRETIVLEPGERRRLDVVMTPELLVRPVPLELAQVEEGILPGDFQALTFSFRDDAGRLHPARDLIRAEILDAAADGGHIPLDEFIVVEPDGTLGATDADAVRALLALRQESEIFIEALGRDDLLYADTVIFQLGEFALSGRLDPPASRPGIAVGDLPIVLTQIGTDIEIETRTDAQGAFGIENVPGGSWLLRSSTLDPVTGQTLNAIGPIHVAGDTFVPARLASPDDLLAGIPMVGIGPASTPGTPGSPGTPPPGPTPIPGGLVVQSQGQGVSVFGARELTRDPLVPSSIVFRLASEEHPARIEEGTTFDDMWMFGLILSSGRIVGSRAGNVSGQRDGSPGWRPDGTTGDAAFGIDPTQFGPGDTTVILFAQATNVGDDLNPTKIEVEFDQSTDLVIESAESIGGWRQASIPLPDATNHDSLRLRIDFAKPRDPVVTTLDQIRIEIVDADTRDVLGEVVDVVLPAPEVVEAADGQSIDVQVTFDRFPSTIQAIPPPTDRIRYRAEIRSTTLGVPSVKRIESKAVTPLWEAPEAVRIPSRRFGVREPGGDAWTRKKTYEWLDAEGHLLPPRVDDIEREHARREVRPPRARRKGRKIDALPIAPGPAERRPPSEGVRRYQRLERDARRAARDRENLRARLRLERAVLREREALRRLLESEGVNQVTAGNGRAAGRLPEGWLDQLRKEGRVFHDGEEIIDLGIGPWANPAATAPRLRSSPTHNARLGVELKR